jgi:transcriptional regulator with XRE-family HTH domain
MQLGSYLKIAGLTPDQFAARIGVDAVSVRRYLAGSRRPAWSVMQDIVRVTEGAVGPDDFLSSAPKRQSREHQVA